MTPEEHKRLDKAEFGWARYIKAGVEVLDMSDETSLDLEIAQRDLLEALGPFLGD